MPLELDRNGNLVPGVHRVSSHELMTTFGAGSPRREWLAERLGEVLSIAAASGIVQHVYVWGSFVTAKPSPGDVDLLLILRAGLEDHEMSGPILALLNHEEGRLRFNSDIFWVREDIGETIIQDMLDTYQFDREQRRRGIVEVTR